MLALDPGPFVAIDRLGVTPAPDRPSFGGIVADGLADAAALRDSLAGSASTIDDPTGAHVDGVYSNTIGGAADVAADEANAVSSSPAGALTDAGQVVPARGGQVGKYLPDAESDVKVNLIDPPRAPRPGEPSGPHGLPDWKRDPSQTTGVTQ